MRTYLDRGWDWIGPRCGALLLLAVAVLAGIEATAAFTDGDTDTGFDKVIIAFFALCLAATPFTGRDCPETKTTATADEGDA